MKLLIAGYYGFGNEGDELLLASLLQALAGRSHTVTVLSRRPAETAARHSVRAVDRWNPFRLLAEILAADALVFGGGGLIQDLSGPYTPTYYLGLLAAAQGLRKKTILIGQGCGPLLRKSNRQLARWVLPRVNWVAARDGQSLKDFRSLGAPDARTVLGADLAWLLPVADPTGPRPEWGACLRADWLQHRLPDWLPALRDLAQRQGRRLRFIALGDQGDQELLNRLRSAPEWRDCVFSGSEERNAGARFGNAEWVVSMRYHGLILAAQYGAAVTGWGRDPKLAALAAELRQGMLPECAGLPELEAAWRAGMASRGQDDPRPRLRRRASEALEAALARLSG